MNNKVLLRLFEEGTTFYYRLLKLLQRRISSPEN